VALSGRRQVAYPRFVDALKWVAPMWQEQKFSQSIYVLTASPYPLLTVEDHPRGARLKIISLKISTYRLLGTQDDRHLKPGTRVRLSIRVSESGLGDAPVWDCDPLLARCRYALLPDLYRFFWRRTAPWQAILRALRRATQVDVPRGDPLRGGSALTLASTVALAVSISSERSGSSGIESRDKGHPT
jgi:hypothetical protein